MKAKKLDTSLTLRVTIQMSVTRWLEMEASESRNTHPMFNTDSGQEVWLVSRECICSFLS